jgi:hypothetical protein
MPTEDEMKAEIERLRAENENLKKPARGTLSLKVSEKGALSVYGPDPRIHPAERPGVEKEGVAWPKGRH